MPGSPSWCGIGTDELGSMATLSSINVRARGDSGADVANAAFHPHRYAHGHAVVGCGETDDGHTLVVWTVNVEGAAVGAWLFSETEACTDRVIARRMLTLVERRSILTATPVAVADLLTKIAHTAGLDVEATDWPMLDLRAAIAEVRELRDRYLNGIRTQRSRTGSKLVMPEFTWSLPADLPADIDALADTLGVAEPRDVPPLVARTLRLARALTRVVAAWQEAEKIKARRPYLLDAFGPAVALPPRWLATVHAAYAAPLPL